MQEPEKYNAPNLVWEISVLIEESKQQVVKAANSALTLLFWQIGKRINDEILKNERAQYGKQIVSGVSEQLELKYGRNFTEKYVRTMMQFELEFSNYEIVVPSARQSTWSHFLILIPLKSAESRIYYPQNAITQNWGKRALRN